MKRTAIFLLAFSGMLPASMSGAADPKSVILSKAERSSISITVYQDGFAQIRDRRRLSLEKGRSNVEFSDVSALINPRTAIIRGLGARTSLVEMNFDYDLLTPASLRAKSVGQPVLFLRGLPKENRDVLEEAVLLSANDGVILDVGGRIEVLRGLKDVGRVAFKEMPPNLRPSPTLSVLLDAPDAIDGRVELSYITGGLSWEATYRLTLADDGKSADLAAFITLRNETGIAFEDAELHALAGEVNRVYEALEDQVLEKAATVGTEEIVVTGSRVSQVSDYQLFSVPEPVNIANNQEKQLALFEARGFGVGRFYEFRAYSGDKIDEWDNAGAFLRIENTKANGLGIPFPEGSVTIYVQDLEGKAQHIGDDWISNTPENRTLPIYLGDAFDLTGALKRLPDATTKCRPIGGGWESCKSVLPFAFRIENSTSKAKEVEYFHSGFENLRVKKSNFKAVADGDAVFWKGLSVPPRGSLTIRYLLEDRFTRRIRDD